MMRNQALFEALMDFPLAQAGGELSFLQRLCRENHWAGSFGLRAIEEYKRFIYLAMVSPTPVTPSDEIDQVWHLHLLYTRSYWEDLTAILGRPLHHGPTAGGQQEDEKFHDWYAYTKALYADEFGQEAPGDLWPPASVRFDPRQRFRRLDAAAYWIFAKPGGLWRQDAGGIVLLLFLLPLMAASGGLAAFAICALIAVILIAVISAHRRRVRSSQDGDGDSDSGGCSGFFSSCSSDGGDCGAGSGDCGGSSGCGGGGCGGGALSRNL